MAKGQCTAQVEQGGITFRCNRDAGHEKLKDPARAIHDSNGITWYDDDENLELSQAEE